MAYGYLAIAIAGELLGTTGLKYAEGFTRFGPSLLALASYGVCFLFLSKALAHMHLSIAYATWCGLGIVASTILSMLLFKEHLTPIGLAGIGLVIAGVVILNLFGTAH